MPRAEPSAHRLPGVVQQGITAALVITERTLVSNEAFVWASVRVRDRVLAMPDPEPARLFEHVYPDGSPHVDRERGRYAAHLASFAGGK